MRSRSAAGRAARVLGPLAGVLAAVGLVGGASLVPSVAEAAPGRCEPGTGVTVVVDYGPLGGGVALGCDPGGAGKAASAVVPEAGFPLTFVNGEPFVCRIAGKPDASQESCARTPPADAYWGLFWADGMGGSWKYATVGVTGLKVPEGGSIGWRFQDGGERDLPGAAPNPPAPASSPSPTKSPTPQPSSPPSSPPAGQPSAQPTAAPPSTAPAGGGGGGGRSGDADGERGGGDGERAGTGADEKAGKEGNGTDGKTRKDRDGDRKRGEADAGPDGDSGSSADADGSDNEVVADATPTSGPPAAGGGDLGLALVAIAAGLVLAATAGVLAWRRRT
jgi:hypothetical protein